MIRVEDVREAIAEMQGQRNPNATTCIKLAAYYTILDHLTSPSEERYSYSGAIDYEGDSEFSRVIAGKSTEDVWAVMDELMDTLKIIQPRLYDAVLRKLE